MDRQKEQRRKAGIIMEGFLAAGTRAEVEPRAGEHGDEVHVRVEGIQEPIRLLPGGQGRGGGVILPPELDHAGPGIFLDLVAR